MNYNVLNDEEDVNNYLGEVFEGRIEPNFVSYQKHNYHISNLKFFTRFPNFLTTSFEVDSVNYLYNKISVRMKL